MGFASGLALKSLQWVLRAIELCCAAIVLGVFSYFLATLHDHNLHVATYIRAVEGISGAAVIYLIFALLLLFCLSGFALFSFLAILLDLMFTGAFIYVAFENRHGANSCTGTVITPFGTGASSSTGDGGSSGVIHLPSLKTACRLETVAFSVSIVAIFFFLLSAFVEFALGRHHQKEKAFGPSPRNNYTQGYARRMPWQRKPKNQGAVGAGALNPDALPLHQTPADMTTRRSYATESTAIGTTEPAMAMGKQHENGGVGAHTASSVLLPSSYDGYDRYRNSAGYQIPDASERTEMPAEMPAAEYARNY